MLVQTTHFPPHPKLVLEKNYCTHIYTCWLVSKGKDSVFARADAVLKYIYTFNFNCQFEDMTMPGSIVFVPYSATWSLSSCHPQPPGLHVLIPTRGSLGFILYGIKLNSHTNRYSKPFFLASSLIYHSCNNITCLQEGYYIF